MSQLQIAILQLMTGLVEKKSHEAKWVTVGMGKDGEKGHRFQIDDKTGKILKGGGAAMHGKTFSEAFRTEKNALASDIAQAAVKKHGKGTVGEYLRGGAKERADKMQNNYNMLSRSIESYPERLKKREQEGLKHEEDLKKYESDLAQYNKEKEEIKSDYDNRYRAYSKKRLELKNNPKYQYEQGVGGYGAAPIAEQKRKHTMLDNDAKRGTILPSMKEPKKPEPPVNISHPFEYYDRDVVETFKDIQSLKQTEPPQSPIESQADEKNIIDVTGKSENIPQPSGAGGEKDDSLPDWMAKSLPKAIKSKTANSDGTQPSIDDFTHRVNKMLMEKKLTSKHLEQITGVKPEKAIDKLYQDIYGGQRSKQEKPIEQTEPTQSPSESQADKSPFYSSFDANEEKEFKSNLYNVIENQYKKYNRSTKNYEYPNMPSDNEIAAALDKITTHFKETGELPKPYGNEKEEFYPRNIFGNSNFSAEGQLPYKTHSEISKAKDEKRRIEKEREDSFVESRLPNLKAIAEQHGMPSNAYERHPVNDAIKAITEESEKQGHGYVGNRLNDIIAKHMLDKEISQSQGGGGINHGKKLFELKKQGKLNHYKLTDNDIDALVDLVNNKATPTGLTKKDKFDSDLLQNRNVTDKIKPVPKNLKPPIQTTQDKIEQASDFAGYRLAKSYLNGVYIDAENKRIVASDGHMLALYQDESLTGDNHLLETRSLKRDDDFDYQNLEYPDFSKVFEGNTYTETGIDGKALVAKFNGIAGLNRAFNIKEYNKDYVRLTANDDNSMVFHNEYLLKAISAAARKNGKVDIGFRNDDVSPDIRNSNAQALIIRPHGDTSESYVVMPMRAERGESGLGEINLADYQISQKTTHS